jgi:NADPH:quinone reductase-like Zn-dependent oxidoreductase
LRAVVMHGYDGLDGLSYEEVADPVPAPGEVVVRVDAAALNHLDLDLCTGTARIPLEFPHILGCDGTGTVEWAPPEQNGGWAAGDRVMILEELPCGQCVSCRQGHQNRCEEGTWIGVSRPGTYAERIAVPQSGLLRLPDDDRPATEWAAVQAAFGTAWHMLVTRGRIKPGETVQINGAGSGIGSAALQIALLAGAKVIATAGSDAKLEHAIELGASAGVNYSTDDLSSAVLNLTGGAGVDLVYDHVGGEVLTASLKTLRSGGRLVTCGAHAGEVVPLDVIELFRSELTLIGSRTCTLDELKTIVQLVANGRLTPVVDSTYPLSEVREALRRMERREQFGKIVLSPTITSS